MQSEMQKGFSKFSWALALFCLPSALFPLAWFLSPHFSHHPDLSAEQINFFSIVFWAYPLALLFIAALLFKLHRVQPALAKLLLALGFLTFYALLWHIVSYF